MTSYRYTGYGVTDSNGIAKLEYDSEGNPLTHSYTGVGAGKVNIVASLDSTIDADSLISEPKEVLDCIKIDYGTLLNHNDIYIPNQSTILTRYDEYSTITSASEGVNSSIPTSISGDVAVLFDLYQVDGSRTSPVIRIYNGNTYITGFHIKEINAYTGEWISCKLEITDTTTTLTNLNNDTQITKEINDTYNRFSLYKASNSNITELRFRNVLIYPI